MHSSNVVEIMFYFMVFYFIASLPGIRPLITWISRIKGDPVRILAQQPTLPWWARGFIGQFQVFLTLNFWIGALAMVLIITGESILGFEVSRQFMRSLSYGLFVGSLALTIQIYQRAASLAFPPYFTRPEKKALKQLKLAGGEPYLAIIDYQRKIDKVLDGPPPLAVDGVNFYDPEAPLAPLAKVGWDQVVCVPQLLTNKYIVVYLEGPLPPALEQFVHSPKQPHYYRVYFSAVGSLRAGVKILALAKHLWVESHKSDSGGLLTPLDRQAVSSFE